MTRGEVINLLNECEKRFPFAQEAWIGDVNIWPMIKIKVGEQLVSNEMDKPADSRLVQNRPIGAIKGSLEHLRLKKKLSKINDILFISVPEHWTNINGQWTERFAHPFISQLEKMGVRSTIANIKQRPKGGRYKNSSEIDLQNAIYWKSLLWWRTADRPALPPVIQDCLNSLKEKGLNINVEYLKEMVFSLLFYDHFFTDLLKDSTTKAIFFVCYYSGYNMGLSQAASRLGIPTIDIQHGVHGRNNIAYGKWLLPEQGYACMPKWFWCWDRNGADHISSWTKGTPHGSIAGGDLWSEAWRHGDLVHEKQNELPVVPSGDLVVLFSLQPVKDELPDTLIAAINKSKNVQWWVRKHPTQMKGIGTFEALLREHNISDKVHYTSASELPLPVVLSAVDVHITNWSSVVLDAGRFGIPSILMHPTGRDVFADLIGRGRVEYCMGDAVELLETISEISSNKVESTVSELDPIKSLKTILDQEGSN